MDNLVYLIVNRPDIAYVIHKVSQFIATPPSSHFSTVLHIIRYVKDTFFMVHTSLLIHPWYYLGTMVQIGQATQQIVAQQQGIISS